MGSKKTTNVTESKDTSIDPWVKERLGENYDFAKTAASTPFQAYNQPRYADFNPTQLEAQGMMTDIGRARTGSQTLADAIAATKSATGYAPQQVTAGSLTDVDLSKYTNPYEQSVVNATANDINMQRLREQNQNTADATKLGAWRGNALGVTNALTNEAWDRNLTSTIANLRRSGYDTATGLAQQDLSRRLMGDTSNQQAGLEANRQALAGGAQLAGLGGQELSQAMTQAGLVGSVGDIQQAFAQQGLDFNWEEFMRQLGYPAQQLAMRNSALGLIPAITDTTGTSSTTARASNPMGTVGTLVKLGSVLAAPFTGGASLAGLAIPT